MFRTSRDNQSISSTSTTTTPTTAAASAEESSSSLHKSMSSSYPALDEKNKKTSLRDSTASSSNNDVGKDLVFQDEGEEDTTSSPYHQRLIKALSAQAYHLPEHTYWEDWKQYCSNNHPMFGICFHHPLHPIKWGMRALCFVASVVFGLVITNIVWLWAESLEDNSAVFSVDVGDQAQRGTNVTQYLIDINEENQIEVTKDMIVLWTFGGALHGLFDNTIWTLTLCSFCDPGGKYEHLHKYKRYGVGLLSFFVLAIAAIATLSVVLRAALDSSEEEVQMNELRSAGLMDDAVDFKGQNKESYEFLMSYAVELAVALLFHFPVIGFILFSGCLNVKGKLPMLGGRPYEVLCEEEELAEINGDVDPETGEPIKRTTEHISNKERSSLLSSDGVRKADGKNGKISGMTSFWNNKARDKGSGTVSGDDTKLATTPDHAPTRNATMPRRNSSQHRSAVPATNRRGSTKSTNSDYVSRWSPTSSSSSSTTNNPGNQQRRGSAGSNFPQQRRGSTGSKSRAPPSTPSSPLRNPRQGNTGTGAREYSGARIYIPQQQQPSSGRVVPGGPSSRPQGRPPVRGGSPTRSTPRPGGPRGTRNLS